MDILSFFKNLFTSKKEVECCDQPTKVSEPSEVKSEEVCAPEIKFNVDYSTGVDNSSESPILQKEEVKEVKDEVKSSPKKKRYYKPKKKKQTPKKGS